MKLNLQTLVSMLWHLTIAQAGVVQLSADATTAIHPNLHSIFTDLQTGNVIHLLVEGYSGEVTDVTLNSDYVPQYHYTNIKDLAVRDSNLEKRDICQKITDCAGLLKDSTAFYAAKGWSGLSSFCTTNANSVSNYFTANDYAHAKAVLDGAIASFAVLVPIGVATYYLNAKLDTLKGSSNQDACGATQPAVVAETTASAMYEFCVSLKNEAMSSATTRFNVADDTSSDLNYNSKDGIQLISKFNIGSVEFDTLAVCKDYGIVWRRDFTTALRRGKERSARSIKL